MPLPYSIDLRWRTVWLALVVHTSPADVARELNISPRTVARYVKLFHQTGEVKPCPRRHGPQRLLGEHEQLILLRLILNNPGIYLNEIRDKQYERVGV